MGRTTACALAVAAVTGAACRTAPAPRDSVDEAARSYVRLVLALGERDADSLDSYHGPAAWQAQARAEHATLADIRARARALADSLVAHTPDRVDDERERRAFLVRQLRAVASRIDVLQGARPPFDEDGFASRVQVNAALPLTVDRALDLACHEAYPGHHTINVLLDARFGGRRPELLVQPLFSPQSLLHEAAASLAPSLVFPDADRAVFERDALFPIARLDPSRAERYVAVARLVDRLHPVVGALARRYLDGALDFPRAAAALEREALMPSADAALKFMNQFRSYA